MVIYICFVYECLCIYLLIITYLLITYLIMKLNFDILYIYLPIDFFHMLYPEHICHDNICFVSIYIYMYVYVYI